MRVGKQRKRKKGMVKEEAMLWEDGLHSEGLGRVTYAKDGACAGVRM